MYEGVVQDLIDELGRLPGVGPKSAQRIAFHLLAGRPGRRTPAGRRCSSRSRTRVRFCAVCGNVAEEETCRICRDPRRDPTVICVVEESKDVVAVERTREFRGRYHVLGGAISPIDGIGPDDLRIRELMTRLADGAVTEVILATDPNLEGEATATYLTPAAAADGLARDAAGEWTAGGRRPGVRRRGHPRAGLRRETIGRMSDISEGATTTVVEPDSDFEDFAQQIADQVGSFLLALRAIAQGEAGRRARSRCCCSRSARCCSPAAGSACTPTSCRPSEYEPDAGPDPDLDAMRLRLAVLLESVDAYTEVFDPYVDPPEIVSSLLSDDLASIADGARARPAALPRRAASARRCGGGSSPTSPPGATRPAACCARCSPWSPTTGSTPSSRASRTRSRPRHARPPASRRE